MLQECAGAATPPGAWPLLGATSSCLRAFGALLASSDNYLCLPDCAQPLRGDDGATKPYGKTLTGFETGKLTAWWKPISELEGVFVLDSPVQFKPGVRVLHRRHRHRYRRSQSDCSSACNGPAPVRSRAVSEMADFTWFLYARVMINAWHVNRQLFQVGSQ